MKLEERDRRILALLGERAHTVRKLAERLDVPEEDLAERLSDLSDNGLATDLGDGRFERTESGRRVLATPSGDLEEQPPGASGRADPDVRIPARFDLAPDEVEAVRDAFELLRYWGNVTEDEIRDAIYPETPAGHETADEWWTGCVRDPLAALPGVVAPATPDGPWRYAGTPEIETPKADGRTVLDPGGRPVYGDVKHALESLALSDEEREAVRAAFAFLRRRGEASERRIRETVYPDHPAGYPSAAAWWDGIVRDAFEALPHVERARGSTWRYWQPTGPR